MHEVIVPQLGSSVNEVIILSWKVKEGDRVKNGDPLCEIESDKAVLTIESFFEGEVRKILVQEGEEAVQGQPVLYIGEPGEEVPPSPAARAPVSSTAADSSSGGRQAELPAGTEAQATRLHSAPGDIRALPKTRKLARELGIDLSEVVPGGPAGEIREADVRSAADAAGPVPEPRLTAEEAELSRNQKSVAARIEKSYREIIPINLSASLNFRALLSARRSRQRGSGSGPSVDACIVWAAARCLARYTRFLSRLENGRLIPAAGIDVAVAVSTPEELYTPVIRCGGLDIDDIDRLIRSFREDLRAGRPPGSGAEPADAVFLVSNLGMYPVDTFNAIIPPGCSGALSVGAVREEIVYSKEKGVTTEPVVKVILSVDHRFINGRIAGEFLVDLKSVIEFFPGGGTVRRTS